MSREIKTEAVVLRVSDVSDADKTYLLFTRVLGKIRARARGVRKPGSKLAGHIATGAVVQVQLHPSGDGWYLLTTASRDSYAEPIDALKQLALVGVVTEIIDALLPDAAPHEMLFDTAAAAIATGAVAVPVSLIVAEFIVKSLRTLGYQPSFTHDVKTGERLQPEDLYWSSEYSGFVNTANNIEVRSYSLRKISSTKPVILLRQLAMPGWISHRLRDAEAEATEVLPLLLDEVSSRCHTKLRSLALLDSLRQA